MLSKLKDALNKVTGVTKEFYNKALSKINKLNLRGKLNKLFNNIKSKVVNIIDIIKGYDIKNVKKDVISFFENIKESIFNFIGSDRFANFVSSLGYEKVNVIAVCVLAFMVIASCFGSNLNFGYSVLCDGKVVAITETRSDALLAFCDAKEDLASIENAKIGDVRLSFVISNKDNFQTVSCAKNSICAVYDGRVDAYGIFAEGVMICALKTEEDANNALEDYKNEYTTENSLEVSFNKNVEVVATRVPSLSVLSKQDALTALKTPVGGIKVHVVSEGETISEIAEMTGTTTKKVMEMNPGLTPESLQIGTKLNVSDTTPAVAVRTKEAVTAIEKIAYDTNKVKDSSQYTGITIVISDGEYGEKEVNYDVYKENGIVTEKQAIAEKVLKEPVTKQVKVGTKERPRYMATGKFRHPFSAGLITSRYGSRSRGFHTGIDLAGSTGSPVYASDGGTVSFAGWSGGYGKVIKINHGNGYETYYAHLSSINVSNGQKVAKGEMIGRVGSTGNSTGPHLHFEIRLNGRTLNPANYIY